MKKWFVRNVLTLAFALMVVPAVNAETVETQVSGPVVMKTDPDW